MSSALSGVIDYLMAQLPAAVQAVDPGAVVQETWPLTITNTMVMVGCEHPDSALAGEGTRMYVPLGAGREEEEFTVPCYVDCYAGGVDQSVTRKNALAIFDAIVAVVRADVTLGGLLKAGRWAELTDVQMVGTRDPEEAKAGRRTVVAFRVHCRNLY